MKSVDPVKRARLQLGLGGSIVILFIVVVSFIFHKTFSTPIEKKEKTTNSSKANVVKNPYEEPTIITDSSFYPLYKQLDWSKTIYDNIPALKVHEYPRAGIIIDLNNSKVLWAKNPTQKLPIASMSKLVTVLLVLEAIEERDDISLNSIVKGTKEAAKLREGVMGVLVNHQYKLEELLQAAVIRSANDCATLAGQFIADYSYEQFIEMMNNKAKELNMNSTHFINPHGLPEGSNDNISTVRDVALVANEILKYPDYLKWASIYQTFAVNGTKELTNTNNLVRKRKTAGVDGLKTGYTHRAGSCLAFSCLRDGRRIFGVVAGAQGAINRDNFVEALLDWAYTQ